MARTPPPPWPKGVWPRLRLAMATCAFAGYVPYGPGTAGSLAGLALVLAIQAVNPPQPLTLWMIAGVLAVASGLIGRACTRAYNQSDPSWFVLDEAAGMSLALACGPGLAPGAVALTFVGFRVLDVLKPPPIAQLERLHGGLGITADDLCAGAVAGLLVRGGYLMAASMGAGA